MELAGHALCLIDPRLRKELRYGHIERRGDGLERGQAGVLDLSGLQEADRRPRCADAPPKLFLIHPLAFARLADRLPKG